MKLICIEEHAIDPAIQEAAQPALQREAPYMGLQNTGNATSRRHAGDRSRGLEMSKALKLAADLGDGRIRSMDEHGIDMQVVSYSSPAQLVPQEQAVKLAQAANDRLAEAIQANPARLSGFAVLPWQIPQAAVDELDRAVTELGLKGVLIVGRPGETFLDDPKYDRVLERLNDLGVPIYLHPYHPLAQVQQPYYGGLKPEVTAQFSLAGWGWHHEAGIHALRLILSGVFERFPKLQVISGHWGEMVPFYLQRLDDTMPPTVTGLSTTITETYRKHVWVTPSGMFYRPQFEFIREVIGVDRLIWSVDYPYLTLDGTRKFLEGLPITDDEAHKIAHRNAEQLFHL
ncbi:amidohydrolase family protein [Mycobacterium sp.]|uniref:amidohydrolase family protein n=1 Tax=Mycobacterium sp. TaxID=1785 RepID=UPI002D5B8637|nr:amidohydrolase family protein [Mycobacterium sp.]HZA12278.1 amidohydrolase family protein [Mycobacterium sp.]